MAMLILLSPSKTQKTGDHYPEFSLPELMAKTETLVDKLKCYSIAELAATMQISEKLAEATNKRYARFTFPPQRRNCSQALLTFRGDVFAEIDVDHYSKEDFQFAQEYLRILSGLYGILRPLDLIQPYRLEMGGKFRPKTDETLYDFWRSDIENSLNNHLSKINAEELVNLASAEYSKVIRAKNIQVPMVNVFFKEKKDATLRTVAIHAKKARGALTDYIIKNRVRHSTALLDFHYRGYVFAEDLSNDMNIVFRKEETL